MPDEESIFDQALIEAGDRDGILTAHDFINGWRTYKEEYEDTPDVCRMTTGSANDMFMDDVLRDMLVTEETIYMTPSVDPERNLALFEERTSEEAFGLIMGMEIIIEDEFRRAEVLLHGREHGITERSVVVTG
jgi:hypothetical protein